MSHLVTMRRLRRDVLLAELRTRGMSIGGFANLSRVHRSTISKALAGRPVTFVNQLKLDHGLELLRLLPRATKLGNLDGLFESDPPETGRSPGTKQEIVNNTSQV